MESIWKDGNGKAFQEKMQEHRAVPRLTDAELVSLGVAGTQRKDNDPVNSPSHYTDGGIETIDFIEAKKLNYNLGNAVKYISRAGKKNSIMSLPAQDLEKAVWYLQREIKNLKG